MDEVFKNALDVFDEAPIYRTDVHGKYSFAQLGSRLLSKVAVGYGLRKAQPEEEKEDVETIERAMEETMVDSAGFGAPSVSSPVARQELRIAEEEIQRGVKREHPAQRASGVKTARYRGMGLSETFTYKPTLSLTNILSNAMVKIRNAIRGAPYIGGLRPPPP